MVRRVRRVRRIRRVSRVKRVWSPLSPSPHRVRRASGVRVRKSIPFLPLSPDTVLLRGKKGCGTNGYGHRNC